MADLIGVDRRINKENPNYKMLKKGIIPSTPPVRFQILSGTLKHKEKGVQTEEISEMYNKSRYKFFLDSPFEISAMCCKVMKKSPMHTYIMKPWNEGGLGFKEIIDWINEHGNLNIRY